MKSTFTERELSAISLNDIKRFLVRRDFQPAGTDRRGRNLAFSKKSVSADDSIVFYIPSSEKYSDYLERVDDIIRGLSRVFSVSPEVIYGDIQHSFKDIMKMRILNPGEYSYSLPLDYAAREIDALKSLFLYSACSEVIELPYFDKPLNEGLKHIQICQFGHTFEGSFGFTINIPLVKQDQILLIENSAETPYERRVSERIIRGLSKVAEAVKADSSDLLVNSFDTGLNARMCDSIVSMSIEGTKSLVIQPEWSLEYRPLPEFSQLDPIRIGEAEVRILEDASFRLKKVEPFEQVIIGTVITLHSKNDPNLDEEFQRTIAMRHEHEGRSVEVKIYLNKADYLLAYSAHGSGRRIMVVGKLFRTGSTWKMSDVSNVDFYV